MVNPIGSQDPADFKVNVGNLDKAMNDQTSESWTDRFGVDRLTWFGIESKANDAINGLAFQIPVDYAAGLNVNANGFTVTYNGVVYAPQPSAVPFTTGTWDAAKWYPIQNLFNQNNLLVFEDYASASAAAATLPDGQVVDVEAEQKRYRVMGGALVFEKNLNQLRLDLNEPNGASLIGFEQDHLGLSRTVFDKLRELKTLGDFTTSTALTVKIPSDFGNLQEAVDYLHPVQMKRGETIDLLIEAGHALTHGLELSYGDYSNFKISSTDPIVALSPEMVFVGSYDSTLAFTECVAPIVNIKIDAGGAGGRTIYYSSARGKVEQNKGAINAGTNCLYLTSGSFVDAYGTVWEGAASHCAWITRCSQLDAEESSFSNSTGGYGITVRRGSVANITNSHINNNATLGLFCTRSYVNFQGREDTTGPLLAECNGNGADGVSIGRGSRATLTGLQANNNTFSGIIVYSGSIADADGCESTGNGVAGVRAFDGGVISANSAVLTGNNRAIICEGGASSISAPSANLSNSVANAIQATNGARVSAVGATATGCGGNTVDARSGSNVTVTSATLTGSGAIAIYCSNAIVTANSAVCTGYTTFGVRASSGSIYFQSGNAQKAGSDTTTDIEINNGSIIHANGASGGYAATLTPNTISGTRGILFK